MFDAYLFIVDSVKKKNVNLFDMDKRQEVIKLGDISYFSFSLVVNAASKHVNAFIVLEV